MLATVSAKGCQALYSCFLSSLTKNYSHSFYSHSLLLFGGGNHDSKLWKPFPLVIACSLEELPVKPLCVGQASHRIILVTCSNATTPHLQCWVLFHSSSSVSPTLFPRGRKNTAIVRIFWRDNYKNPNEDKMSKILHKQWRQRVPENLEVAHICCRDHCQQPTSVHHMSKCLWEGCNVGPLSTMDPVQGTEASALYFSILFLTLVRKFEKVSIHTKKTAFERKAKMWSPPAKMFVVLGGTLDSPSGYISALESNDHHM